MFPETTTGIQNSNIVIEDRHPTNTSDHTLVTANIPMKIDKTSTQLVKIYTRPNWAKCDTNIYTSTLKQELECESRRKESSVEERIKLLEKSIHKAGKKSIPKYRQLKSLKTVGKGIWNRKISEASRDSKNAHTLWKRKINSHQNADTEKINLTSKKRKLRQLQRQAYASKKEKFINDIMQASQKDSKTFHKLVKQQRSKHDTNTDILYIGNKAFEGEKILSAWQTHFETLGTPNFDENIFDLERLELAKLQNKIIPELDIQNKEITKATPTEIESAIRKLNTGKASDENGIVSEHYIHAIDVITDEITDIINQIFEELDVPQSLKNGILTPVLKKEKDKTIPGNYRGIVVTSIFSKIFETIIKDRLEPELFPSQNTLQRGFTEGASSLFTAFIVSETTMLYKFLKIVLELLTLDAEKAFDTVTHEIMLNKMFHDGIRGDMWVLLKNIYTNMTLQVKWGDQTTQHVNIQQGIRQGAKLSTLLYKRYNNTILNSITGSHLGAKIGTICVASPTCADDIALLGEPQDIQAMLNIIEFHTKRDMVKINPEKSEVLCTSKGKNYQQKAYTLGEKQINRVDKLKHLGITRNVKSKVNTDERLKTGRQTIYALLGSGLHARTGMCPLVLCKIWKTYVVPRYLYGLEVQICTKADIYELEKLQRKIFRQFLSLPERTASSALYILLGAEPVETILDRNMLSLFLTISRLDNAIEKKILQWELEIGKDFTESFINRIDKILNKYSLPNPKEILENPPSKYKWKNMLKKAINIYWSNIWKEECLIKTTIKYLTIQENPTENPHNIWKAARNNQNDIRKAEFKSRLITGTYIPQTAKQNCKIKFQNILELSVPRAERTLSTFYGL
ncbi:unnamed protein product [Mytilus edulis]|uniref:Reverse transcriptase domain-containing protein n=1 Tax=Mytilus edulis TaxID=6550 RepID=A0A8S3PM65_MYTED|nr:unnamed protein product [Mytilus edulis]